MSLSIQKLALIPIAKAVIVALLLIAFAVTPFFSYAATTPHPTPDPFIPDVENLERARVTEVSNVHDAPVAGTNIHSKAQTLGIEVIDGPDKGMTATFENDFTQLAVGDIFYARHTISSADGTEYWYVSDPYRLPVLGWLAAGFVALLLLIGGAPGIRGLATLIGSMLIIFYILIPGIYHGYSPILLSIGVASLIIVVGSYITHGFNRTTTVAMLGMIGTVLVTGALTYYVIHAAALSGFTSETNAYLNINTDGKISMLGLLYGGIMIGLLGVLYDIAIGQAVAVEELVRAGAHYTRQQLFRRGMRIGREHIGALVNTLAIAYVGTSLPLLLLFQQSTSHLGYIVNGEIFATEIVRILIGSIGLVLAVPVTTVLAVYLLHNRTFEKPSENQVGHSH
jgi:uncharacterized membrane protein